jgi:glycerol-3-phosphate dehydrogenase (NAD(P)+)
MSKPEPGSRAQRSKHSVAVLGAGSWGTALSLQLLRCGSAVVLWSWEADHVEAMQSDGRNDLFLPGFDFPPGLRATNSVQDAIEATDEVLIVVPSHAFRDIVEQSAPWLRPGQGVAWASKGLEPGTGRFLHEAALDALGQARPLAIVTGPSFATEVAKNLPTAVTVAGTDDQFNQRVASMLHGGNFRAYTSDDLVGAELGGSIKNVLAVATGICDAMGLGDNARAALMTRGLAEMMRLGRVLGAREQTLIGLAGMGDLVLTCTGDLSRNRRLGLALGAGKSVEEAVAEIGQVVEGVSTSSEVWRLARRHGLEMPISEQIYGIIHKGWNPARSLRELLAREQKPERV